MVECEKAATHSGVYHLVIELVWMIQVVHFETFQTEAINDWVENSVETLQTAEAARTANSFYHIIAEFNNKN